MTYNTFIRSEDKFTRPKINWLVTHECKINIYQPPTELVNYKSTNEIWQNMTRENDGKSHTEGIKGRKSIIFTDNNIWHFEVYKAYLCRWGKLGLLWWTLFPFLTSLSIAFCDGILKFHTFNNQEVMSGNYNVTERLYQISLNLLSVHNRVKQLKIIKQSKTTTYICFSIYKMAGI